MRRAKAQVRGYFAPFRSILVPKNPCCCESVLAIALVPDLVPNFAGSSISTLPVDRERKPQPYRCYERPNFECESKLVCALLTRITTCTFAHISHQSQSTHPCLPLTDPHKARP